MSVKFNVYHINIPIKLYLFIIILSMLYLIDLYCYDSHACEPHLAFVL